MYQMNFFDLSDHFRRLSDAGDPLETMSRVIDFESFRPVLDDALNYSQQGKGGRPAYDPVVMFKLLILAAQYNLSDARMEFLTRDRLSWQRFLGFHLGERTPDENTIRLFREKLTEAGAIRALFDRFERDLAQAGYVPMAGQILDATLVSSPVQRNNNEEKEAIKAGKSAADIWSDNPARAAQKDVDARWTLKQGKGKSVGPDGKPQVAFAIPVFGYKNHIGIDKKFGFIRTFLVTHGAASDGARLREGLIDPMNRASAVWADKAYRSKENEAFLEKKGKVSLIHQKKQPGKRMDQRTARANARKSKVRCRVEHVFAHQKSRMGLFIRTIGIARATTKIGLANLAYNLGRLIFHERDYAKG